VLRCQQHGIEFELASGRALNAPSASLEYLPVVYDADRVGIDL
jgi:nitrite reductase/ring-hydroxylating ferredoxin subunit